MAMEKFHFNTVKWYLQAKICEIHVVNEEVHVTAREDLGPLHAAISLAKFESAKKGQKRKIGTKLVQAMCSEIMSGETFEAKFHDKTSMELAGDNKIISSIIDKRRQDLEKL